MEYKIIIKQLEDNITRNVYGNPPDTMMGVAERTFDRCLNTLQEYHQKMSEINHNTPEKSKLVSRLTIRTW